MRVKVTNPIPVGQVAFCEIKAFAMIGPSDTLIRGNDESLVDISSVASVYLHFVSVGGATVRHIYGDIRGKNI